MKKKAQITIFIILLLVIIVAFGFLFYSAFLIKKQPLDKREDKVIEELMQSTAIKYYVTSCLDKSLRDGLVLVGMQGGVLYHDQVAGGVVDVLIDSVSVSYESVLGREVYKVDGLESGDAKVLYGIKKPERQPPEYPYSGSIKEFDEAQKRIYGNDYLSGAWFVFPHLCSHEGFFNQSSVLGVNWVCDILPNETITELSSFSIQGMLENYVEEKFEGCFDINDIKEETGRDVSKGDLDVVVGFGDEEVSVDLGFPLTITIEGKPPITKAVFFKAVQPIRFKHVYELAKKIVEKDIGNITYNLSSENEIPKDCLGFKEVSGVKFNRTQKDQPCLKRGMNITYLENVSDITTISDCKRMGVVSSDCNKDDIAVINDTGSDGKQEPYYFMFAVENRIPVLDYIEDINVNEGDTIEIYPLAFDPDNAGENPDNVNFYLKGWKTASNIPGTSQTLGDKWSDLQNDKISYDTENGDDGDHTLRIIVCDEKASYIANDFDSYKDDCDWQDVKIYVDDVLP